MLVDEPLQPLEEPNHEAVLHVAKIHGDVGIDLLHVEHVAAPLKHANDPGAESYGERRSTCNQHVNTSDENAYKSTDYVEPYPTQEAQRRPDALVGHRHMENLHAMIVAFLYKRPERPVQRLFCLKAWIAVEMRRG